MSPSPVRSRAVLNVSTSGTDSDFMVKLIDVYPNDFPNPSRIRKGCGLGKSLG